MEGKFSTNMKRLVHEEGKKNMVTKCFLKRRRQISQLGKQIQVPLVRM